MHQSMVPTPSAEVLPRISPERFISKPDRQFGGGNASTVTCSEIVAWRVEMIGNATLKVSNCVGSGVLPIGGGQPTMVE